MLFSFVTLLIFSSFAYNKQYALFSISAINQTLCVLIVCSCLAIGYDVFYIPPLSLVLRLRTIGAKHESNYSYAHLF